MTWSFKVYTLTLLNPYNELQHEHYDTLQAARKQARYYVEGGVGTGNISLCNANGKQLKIFYVLP
jgi:hypothetical protein